MTKSEVLELLGEPTRRDVGMKTTRPIFGPVEGFWDRLEVGQEYELWIYERKEITLYVAFLNGSASVGDVSEYPSAVVF